MSNLVLNSLEIKNFRAFKHLRIEKLGRVNLVVGKNNVGKSTVLEALWLYVTKGEPAVANHILLRRDEMVPLNNREARRGIIDAQERALALNNLFYGHEDTRKPHNPITIGPMDNLEETISINILWPSSKIANEDNKEIQITQLPQIVVGVGINALFANTLDQNYRLGYFALRPDLEINKYAYVPSGGLDPADASEFWDRVALSSSEKDVIAALKIIAPDVEAVNLVGNESKNGDRIAKVRMKSDDSPVPLRSLGDGMNHMFGIALALVNAKDGMLLIDEVDTGLHYSVLPDVWKLIFEVAHRLNVQVFATSHSWDCIQAFQQAAADNKDEEGVLVRLENRKAGVGAVTFNERDLAIVTREQIEVR